MESWVFYSLLYPMIYASTNFVDKYLLSGINSRIMPIYTALVGLIAGVIFFVLTGFPIIPLRDTILILTTGILNTLSLIVYFKVLDCTETSRVNILFEIIPLFVLVLGYLFLGETITFIQFIGFVIVLSSIITIAYFEEGNAIDEKIPHQLSKTTVFVYIVIYDLMFAISAVLAKFVMSETSFNAILSYESLGIGLGGMIILVSSKTIRNEFLESNISMKQKYFVGANETLFVLAKTITFYAFSLGPVALVSVIGAIQPLIAVLMGWLLTICLPKVFSETISKKSLSVKFFAAIAIIFGIYLIQS